MYNVDDIKLDISNVLTSLKSFIIPAEYDIYLKLVSSYDPVEHIYLDRLEQYNKKYLAMLHFIHFAGGYNLLPLNRQKQHTIINEICLTKSRLILESINYNISTLAKLTKEFESIKHNFQYVNFIKNYNRSYFIDNNKHPHHHTKISVVHIIEFLINS